MIQALLNLFKPKQPDWKKPIELHLTKVDNILTVTTLDRNQKQYRAELYSNYLGEIVEIKWRHFSSFILIKDKALKQQLDEWFNLLEVEIK